MDSAVKACREGLSINAAAAKFNVPRTTLRRRLAGVPEGKRGPKRKFDSQEEERLVNAMLKAAAIGIPFDKALLKKLIIRVCSARGFFQFKFSDKWYRQLLKRNPIISQRIYHSTNNQEEREWSVETHEGWLRILSELHMEGYLDDPDGIHNLDESTFSVTDSVSLVYALRGNRSVSAVTDGNECELVTVLACGTASGRRLRPLVLFDGRCVMGMKDNQEIVEGIASFTDYIQKEVLHQMTAKKNVIFIDGRSSYSNNEEFLFSCLNSDKDIRVVCFPSGQASKKTKNSSTFSVLGPIKKYWIDFLRTDTNVDGETVIVPLETVTKPEFASKLIARWSSDDLADDLISGFQTIGIFPYDPSAIIKPFELTPVVSDKKIVTKRISKKKEPKPKFFDTYAAQLIGIEEFLRHIRPISENGRKRIMDLIVRVGEGRIAESAILPGEINGIEIKDSVAEYSLKKKKMESDPRLVVQPRE